MPAKKYRKKLTKKESKKAYQKYKKYYRDYHKKVNARPEVKKARKEENRMLTINRNKFLDNYKKDKCCFKCGWNKHTEILQFHHKNPKEKRKCIADLRTISTIEKELIKCILLCPNCHFWIHHREGINQYNPFS